MTYKVSSGTLSLYSLLAPAVFCISIDWIIKHMSTHPQIEVGLNSFTDLVCADDTAFSCLMIRIPRRSCQASAPQRLRLVYKSYGPRQNYRIWAMALVLLPYPLTVTSSSPWTRSSTSVAFSPLMDTAGRT